MVSTSRTSPKPMVLAPAAQRTLPRPPPTLGGLVVDTPDSLTLLPAQPSTPGVSVSMTVLVLILGALFVIHHLSVAFNSVHL